MRVQLFGTVRRYAINLSELLGEARGVVVGAGSGHGGDALESRLKFKHGTCEEVHGRPADRVKDEIGADGGGIWMGLDQDEANRAMGLEIGSPRFPVFESRHRCGLRQSIPDVFQVCAYVIFPDIHV